MLLGLAFSYSAQAQKKGKTRVLFIYDASNSMNGKWESGNKHAIARKLLSQSLDSLRNVPNLELALRVYGHQSHFRHGQDCNDTKLEVPFKSNNAQAIIDKLGEIQPKGTTPIAMTLEKAGKDFTRCEDCRNVIILITDGIEECDGDPCAVSQALQSKGIILKPFIIGVGLDDKFMKTFKCVGNYFDASNEDVFQNVLGIVISQALNSTTAQVNLLDEYGKPNETNVAFTLYDQFSGNDEYNFLHTLNGYGNPDTLFIDPSGKYELVVHTLPPVIKKDVTLTPGIHNTIGVSTPRGTLFIKNNGKGQVQPSAIVRKKGESETLFAQTMGTQQLYLTGEYDLEILTLPRTKIEGVKISQSHTTTIEIPPSGLATIMRNKPGYGSLFVKKGTTYEWVYDFSPTARTESIRLQPGNYRIIFRPKAATDTKYTKIKDFKISSGVSTAVKLF